MEAVQWHLVHTYKHRDWTDHWLFQGNTDWPWKMSHRNNTSMYGSLCTPDYKSRHV